MRWNSLGFKKIKIFFLQILFGHVKAVSRQHAEILLNKYAISVVQRSPDGVEKKRALFTGSDIPILSIDDA